MKALLFSVSHKRCNSSLPLPVLILRGVGFSLGDKYLHTALNCQQHPHPSPHLLIPCNQAQRYWDKSVYANNQDLCES